MRVTHHQKQIAQATNQVKVTKFRVNGRLLSWQKLKLEDKDGGMANEREPLEGHTACWS